MTGTRANQNQPLISGLATFWAASLVLAPLLYVVVISFLSRGTYGGVEAVPTIANYARIFEAESGSVLGSIMGRSLWLALASTLLCILAGFPLALFLVFRAGRYRQALFFLLIIPFWTNFLIRTYAWVVILSDNGWLNQVAESAGLGPQFFHLLFTPQAVLLGMFYNYLPYMAMSLYVSVEKLDVKLLEAAADLGAGPLTRFYKIILPLSVPGLVAGSIMVFIPALGEFVIPDILGGGTNLYMGNLLAQQFLTVRHWPFGAALSVILILIIGLCIYLSERGTKDKPEELLA